MVFDKATSGTINVWGNKFDLYWRRCASMRTTTANSTCLSYHCPRKNDISMAFRVNLMEVASQKATEMYIEAAVREWLMPAPSQCGRHFSIAPPVTADAVLGWQTLDLISGQLYQSFVTVSVQPENIL